MSRRPVLTLWIILAAVLLLNIFRAVTQSLTIDEELGNRPGWAGIPLQGILESGAI